MAMGGNNLQMTQPAEALHSDNLPRRNTHRADPSENSDASAEEWGTTCGIHGGRDTNNGFGAEEGVFCI